MVERRPRRATFVLVLAACAVLGVFGLGWTLPLELAVLGSPGIVVWMAVRAGRARVDRPRHAFGTAARVDPSTVIVRRLGEGAEAVRRRA